MPCMKHKVLVIGGTKFFGKHLVTKLVRDGHDVTILSRGNKAVPEGVSHLIADRSHSDQLMSALKGKSFDVVFDQVCYQPEVAELSLRAFKDRTHRYVFTSSVSVYEQMPGLVEASFDPMRFEVPAERPLNYADGKRAVEKVFLESPLSTVMVRIPIVMGVDDDSQRLIWHMDRIRNGEPIYFPNIDASMSFIDSVDAGEFIAWCGFQDFTGPINAASEDTVKLSAIVSLIEKTTAKSANLLENEGEPEEHSPYGVRNDWTVSVARAVNEGFSFQKLKDWLPPLVKRLHDS